MNMKGRYNTLFLLAQAVEFLLFFAKYGEIMTACKLLLQSRNRLPIYKNSVPLYNPLAIFQYRFLI